MACCDIHYVTVVVIVMFNNTILGAVLLSSLESLFQNFICAGGYILLQRKVRVAIF